MSLRICVVSPACAIWAVSPEPLLFAHTIQGTKEASDKEPGIWLHWMAGHARLKDHNAQKSLGPFSHETAQIKLQQE